MNKEQIAIELTKIYLQNINRIGINRMDILNYYNYFLKQLEDK